MILRWLLGHHGPDYIPNWNAYRADLAWQATERMLLGWAGAARVVGNRLVEAREARVADRRAKDATIHTVVLAWQGRP